jgi:hypothetical protein
MKGKGLQPRGAPTSGDCFGLGVDVPEVDFDHLGQYGHEPSARQVWAAFAGSRIEAYDREGVGWRDIPARWEVRSGPVWRDREDEFDLAYVGGEAGAATHRAT